MKVIALSKTGKKLVAICGEASINNSMLNAISLMSTTYTLGSLFMLELLGTLVN